MNSEERYVDILATYNSEVARGIVHTKEWVLKMKEYQQRFDNESVVKPKCEQCGKECEVIINSENGRIKSIECKDHPGEHASGDYSYICGCEYCRCCQ